MDKLWDGVLGSGTCITHVTHCMYSEHTKQTSILDGRFCGEPGLADCPFNFPPNLFLICLPSWDKSKLFKSFLPLSPPSLLCKSPPSNSVYLHLSWRIVMQCLILSTTSLTYSQGHNATIWGPQNFLRLGPPHIQNNTFSFCWGPLDTADCLDCIEQVKFFYLV